MGGCKAIHRRRKRRADLNSGVNERKACFMQDTDIGNDTAAMEFSPGDPWCQPRGDIAGRQFAALMGKGQIALQANAVRPA